MLVSGRGTRSTGAFRTGQHAAPGTSFAMGSPASPRRRRRRPRHRRAGVNGVPDALHLLNCEEAAPPPTGLSSCLWSGSRSTTQHRPYPGTRPYRQARGGCRPRTPMGGKERGWRGRTGRRRSCSALTALPGRFFGQPRQHGRGSDPAIIEVRIFYSFKYRTPKLLGRLGSV